MQTLNAQTKDPPEIMIKKKPKPRPRAKDRPNWMILLRQTP
jgi:hypothetical protein